MSAARYRRTESRTLSIHDCIAAVPTSLRLAFFFFRIQATVGATQEDVDDAKGQHKREQKPQWVITVDPRVAEPSNLEFHPMLGHHPTECARAVCNMSSSSHRLATTGRYRIQEIRIYYYFGEGLDLEFGTSRVFGTDLSYSVRRGKLRFRTARRVVGSYLLLYRPRCGARVRAATRLTHGEVVLALARLGGGVVLVSLRSLSSGEGGLPGGREGGEVIEVSRVLIVGT